MATNVLRCPECRPRYRVVRIGSRRNGWVVSEDYVGYLVPAKGDGVPPPPVTCPECGSTLVRRECGAPAQLRRVT